MTTKNRDTQKRSWLLTIPAENNDQATVEKKLERYRFIGQLERGEETGYLHWQVLIDHPHAIRFSTLKNLFPTAHIEPRKGNLVQAIAYVTKAETFAGVSIGNMKDVPEAKEKKLGLADFHAMISEGVPVDDLIANHPSALYFATRLRELERTLAFQRGKELREVKALYLHGKTGVGKTRALWETYGASMYRVSNYAHPWDSYRGESVLVLDEFYGGNIGFDLLLNVLDRYPLELPARYANKNACWTTVAVVSNIPLSDQYTDIQASNPRGWQALLRRFAGEVYELDDSGEWLKDGQKSPSPLR